MTEPALRDTGIEALGHVPWGTHFCQFYQTTQDLVDVLVPYFKAGLANNEFCMWVTSPPLAEKEAEEALRQVMPDLDRYRERGQIEILPYSGWYLKGGYFESQRVLDGWVEKLETAQARGFAGLRLSGNTFWLEKAERDDFADYENAVNNVIGNYAMIALCTYSLEKCGAPEIVDVIGTHQFALIKRADRWEIIESAERRRIEEQRKQAEEELRKANEEWERTFNAIPDLIAILDSEYRVVRANRAMAERLGVTPDQCVGLHCYEVVHGADKPPASCPFAQTLKDGREHTEEVHEDRLGGDFIVSTTPIRDSEGQIVGAIHLARDITERKKAEEAVRDSQEKLATLLELVPLGIGVLDAERTLLYSNPSLGKIVRLSKEDAQAKAYEKRTYLRADGSEMPPDEIPSAQATAAGAAVEDVEVGVKLESGETIWTSVSAAPLPFEDWRMVLITQDITHRKQFEEALRESEEKFSSLYSSMIEGVALHELVYDSSGKPIDYIITDVNPAFETITGLSRDEIIGRRASEAYGTGEAPYLEIYARVAASGKPETFEIHFPPMQKHFHISAFSPAKGRFATAFQDVTQRRRAEEEISSLARFPAENPGPVLRLSRDGTILYANPASQAVIREWGSEVGGPAPAPLRALVEEAFAKQSGATLEIARGEKVWSFVVTPIAGFDYANLYGRDVTKGRQAEQALREREADLNRAQAVGHIGSWRMDVRRNVLDWSEESYRIFGIPLGTPLTYEAFLDCIHPEDRGAVDEAWQAALGGAPYDIEHRIIVGDSVKWVREQAELEIDAQGDILGGFGTCRDITGRKKAEEALQLRVMELDAVFDAVEDGLMICDDKGRALRANPAMLNLLGYTPEDVRAPYAERFRRSKLSTVDGRQIDFDESPIVRAIKGETTSGQVYRLERADGHLSWGIISAAPLRMEDGTVWGVAETLADITEMRMLQEDLERANAAKDDFLGMVSHEMRTPLTVVLGNASLLISSQSLTDDERRELLEEIRIGAKRLAATINNMLALARAESRKARVEPLAVEPIIDELITQHRERHDHREVQKHVVGETPEVIGTREYLVHILSNLLENAEKYTPHHEPIEIEVKREDGQLAIRVRDRGVGLTPEEAESVFEPFYRSPRLAEVSSGIGIGLAVSKRLVEALGGRIWALPREGGGSEFGFTLPAAG